MQILAIDQQGKAAYIDIEEEYTVHRHLRYLKAAKIKDGRTIKEPVIDYPFPQTELPLATPILVHTNFGLENYGEKALTFNIGFEAENGFTTLPEHIIQANYKRVK